MTALRAWLPALVRDAADKRGLSVRQLRRALGWRDLTEDERAEQLSRNLDDVCPAESAGEKDCEP